MAQDISKMRNIGISAHIDSGKTTLTERILFYCKKIHAIHEVRGKDGIGATMDSMELERERGITISSAATNVEWGEYQINIIDTPGHVDFTIEVERSLRVLDGAILVLCSVGGVQSQSITVDRQMKRYNVPRIAFINKCDRTGADPFKVRDQLQEKLGHNAVLMQIPIGVEEKHEGMVDLVRMKALYFSEPNGMEIEEREIPDSLRALAEEKREVMLDAVSMFSDELMEAMMEETVTEELIHDAVRRGTLSLDLTPVYLGSAYRNKGVQPLLNAITRYLPSPYDVNNIALDLEDAEKEIRLETDPAKPVVALAFKLEDGQYGQLTYIRVYQGTIKKGDELYNSRSQRNFKVGRLIKMHADHMADVSEAVCGDIAALFGIDCASGDTFCGKRMKLSMTSMYVPEPVISLALYPTDKTAQDNIAKALNRFTKEDPTFRTHVDGESGETIIQGMGELHLDVYVERMRREYRAAVETGRPQVAYREAISQRAEFDYTHRKQTGGSGQYGRVVGYIEPLDEGTYEFVSEVKGGNIPTEYVPACDKGFQEAIRKGSLIGFPIVGIRAVLTDGASHSVDSSDMAFQTAALFAFREAYGKAEPQILEPVMEISIEGPTEYQGNYFASINQRRGIIVSTVEEGEFCRVEAEVPLSEMFGYSTVIRSLSQGKAEYSMEFSKYGRVPKSLQQDLVETYRDRERH